MNITLDMVGAFIVGGIIPLMVALLGKEPLGRWLTGRQQREDTALSALISLAQESVAGWRESNVVIAELSSSMREHSERSERRLDIASDERTDIKTAVDKSSERLGRMEERLDVLIHILGETDAA